MPHDTLIEEALKLARQIAANSPEMVQIIKKVATDGYSITMAEGRRLELQVAREFREKYSESKLTERRQAMIDKVKKSKL